MTDDRAELKKIFDGTHDRGTLTFAAMGSSSPHQLITLFLKVEDPEAGRSTRLECQMTPDQAQYISEIMQTGLLTLELNTN